MEVSGLPSPHSEAVLDSFPGRKTARQRLACRKVMACALGSNGHARVGWGRGRRYTALSCRHRDLSRSQGELWTCSCLALRQRPGLCTHALTVTGHGLPRGRGVTLVGSSPRQGNFQRGTWPYAVGHHHPW